MYSLNAPVPSSVATLAGDLAGEVPTARSRPRGSHTLVVKRLPEDIGYAQLEARAREILTGTPPCQARVTGIELFETVPTGPAPVVYLAVESPGLRALHQQLCETFAPVDGIEGDDYVPHVTIARGGRVEAARGLAEREIDDREWTVEELVFWDAEREQPVSRVSLPA